MGLAPQGQGVRAALEGWTQADGKLPINRSGGLKSKGHPVGATGVSMHVMAAMQLTGQAGAMQLPKAEVAGVFNMGGAAVANYVSILEQQRARVSGVRAGGGPGVPSIPGDVGPR
jgi:acetyl-CoA C-acetyltransferase